MKQDILLNYYQELYALSKEIIRIYDSFIPELISKHENSEEGKEFLEVNPEAFLKLSAIFVHSHNIRKLLIPTARGKKESKRLYDFRCERALNLQRHIPIDNLNELLNSKIRNTIEHYDERLDSVNLKIDNKTLKSKYSAVFSNMIISSEKVPEMLFEGDVYYLKTFVIESRNYRNLDFSSNVEKLYEEVKIIKDIIEENFDLPTLEGGGIYVL
ncbi:hypothetical protein [Macrococcus equipercicus]|uniref:Uncharacterized protein n=1 Tax=Macrococcus equipercicus TaxID=69967 RepID=A0A9Q9BSB4_9STAP|nr:hypothetical protein [Macrococcus equipercicus]UTH13284.1 hypothetical protein KFV11_08415 [Macrococcus equipercicus]